MHANFFASLTESHNLHVALVYEETRVETNCDIRETTVKIMSRLENIESGVRSGKIKINMENFRVDEDACDSICPATMAET